MRYICDCGAIYSTSAGVIACGDNNHGQPRPALFDIKRATVVELMTVRDEISNELARRHEAAQRSRNVDALAQRMLQRSGGHR